MNCMKCGEALPQGALFCPACGKRQTKIPRKSAKRPNGSGTVYRLQGRRSRPWVAAKNKVIVGYYPTKKDAVDALERLSGQSLTERYNMTFAEVFEAWSAEHYPEVGPKGVEAYNRAFDVFAPLHDKIFRSLRTADFQAVLDPHMNKSHSTVNKYKQLITQMSSWAIREEMISTNFAKFVRLPENVKKEKEIFSDAEIQKLEADGSDAAKIVLMLLYTGMRIGELFSLPLSDYHESYVAGGEKTEAGRNRIIPIRPEGRPYFAYFAAHATGPLLLSGYAGNHVSSSFRRWDYYPLLERLGIRHLTPHSTRHTYASWARKNHMAPEILQKIIGHSNYSTTANIYVHTDASELIAAVEASSATSGAS